MQQIIERANQLKKDLVDFVYDAEGELAVSLEKYAAEQGKKPTSGSQTAELNDRSLYDREQSR